MNPKKDEPGFIFLGAQAAAVVLGLLASVVLLALSSAREKSRDARRVADARQVSYALESYKNDNHRYPIAITPIVFSLLSGLGPQYIDKMPDSPQPPDNGCGSHYIYQTPVDGSTYNLAFCLGAPTGDYSAGTHTLSPSGIQ